MIIIKLYNYVRGAQEKPVKLYAIPPYIDKYACKRELDNAFATIL